MPNGEDPPHPSQQGSMERGRSGTPSRGYLASALGTLIGAILGGFGLALIATLLALGLLAEPNSDWLIVLGDEGVSGGLESVFAGTLGFAVGFLVGGALGCLVALRLARQPRRAWTALLTAGLLIAVLVASVLFANRFDGWLPVVVFLLLAITGSAILARRLTLPRRTA